MITKRHKKKVDIFQWGLDDDGGEKKPRLQDIIASVPSYNCRHVDSFLLHLK